MRERERERERERDKEKNRTLSAVTGKLVIVSVQSSWNTLQLCARGEHRGRLWMETNTVWQTPQSHVRKHQHEIGCHWQAIGE